MPNLTKPCINCGTAIQRTKPTGPIPKLCVICKPPSRTACVGCGSHIGLTPRVGRGSAPARKYCSDACKPRCAVAACSKPQRKREWCVDHYAVWRTRGEADATPNYKWSTERRCLTCGTTDAEHWKKQSRKFCTDTCKVTWDKYRGNVPVSFDCTKCGVTVPYFDEVSRRRLRSDSAFCARHARTARVKVSVAQLAAEDGPHCRLCGELVDFSIQSPNRLSPSVDHIIPRALGGSDARENLQLAHRGCNSSKRHLFVG